MSSDNASSAVTYRFVSSDSNGPSSWGILLVNIGELSEMYPYKEVAQQGQEHLLSPAYVPDPMELDEHVPVYVLEPKHPEYHATSDDDIQVKDQPYADDASSTAELPGYIADSDSMEEDTDADSIDYPDEPEDGEEDDDEDPEEDPSEEHEPEDDGNDDDIDEEPTKGEEEKEHPALANSSAVPVVDHVPSVRDIEAFETDEAQKIVRLEPPMSAYMEARIAEHAAAPIPPTSPAYDQAPLAESSAAARAPRGQYDFVDNVEGRQGLIRSLGHDARTITRAADRAKDVGYVRALQASEHRMMTSIEEVNLRVSYQAQRTAYEIELHEVCQAYLSFETQKRALLARIEILELT
ncbi:hypothetical protein Tco_0778940 [Tanacetum coccineum]